MVPPHCYHDCLVMDVKEPFDPVNRLLEDLMCVSPRAPPPPAALRSHRLHDTGRRLMRTGAPCSRQAAAVPAPGCGRRGGPTRPAGVRAGRGAGARVRAAESRGQPGRGGDAERGSGGGGGAAGAACEQRGRAGCAQRGDRRLVRPLRAHQRLDAEAVRARAEQASCRGGPGCASIWVKGRLFLCVPC